MNLTGRLGWLVLLMVLANSAALAQFQLSTNYLGLTTSTAGGVVFFDLTVHTPVQITQIDCNVGNGAGASGTIEFLTVPGTYVGATATAWRSHGIGAIASTAGPGLGSVGSFAEPVTLMAGSYGVALQLSATLAHRYSNTGSAQNFSDARLLLQCGAAAPSLGGPLFTPRIWNGTLHYREASALPTLAVGGISRTAPGTAYFDVTAAVPLLITDLDVFSTASTGSSETLRVYVVPGSRVGRETDPTGWRLSSTATFSSTGGGPVRASLATPFVLAAGNWGLAVEHVHAGFRYTVGTGANQTFANSDLTLQMGAVGEPFGVPMFEPRVWNGTIRYFRWTGLPATSVAYGTGCYERFASWYELFPALPSVLSPLPFDLRSGRVRLVPTGSGYTVQAGTGVFVAPVAGSHLSMTDESNRTQFLPFTFGWPGGSTNVITVCSNGYLWLGNVADAADPSPSVAELHARGPRLCPLWTDLVPAPGQDVHFELLPGNVGARVTWNNQQARYNLFGGQSSRASVQVDLMATGEVVFQYGAETPYPACLVGFSPGGGALVAPSRDLSASMPFATHTDTLPLALSTVSPMLAGGIAVLRTSEIPAGSPFGALLVGNTRYSPGLPLDSIGMPDCQRYTSGSQTILFLSTGATADVGLRVSNNPAFLGLQFACQSAVYAPGANALQVIASNGVQLTLGNL